MSTFHAVDMREGNPVTQIIRFSIPMLIGNIAQQLDGLVNLLDRFIKMIVCQLIIAAEIAFESKQRILKI